jgi:hypothetical protein
MAFDERYRIKSIQDLKPLPYYSRFGANKLIDGLREAQACFLELAEAMENWDKHEDWKRQHFITMASHHATGAGATVKEYVKEAASGTDFPQQ